MDVTTSTGDSVKVTNVPVRTLYYRGRYFRTNLTVSTTSSDFRMISRDTFYGGSYYALRWWATEEQEAWMSYRYDSSRCSWRAPF